MKEGLAIVIAGMLVALAIVLTNHWQVAAAAGVTYRLNRWTGRVDTCFPIQDASGNQTLVNPYSNKPCPYR